MDASEQVHQKDLLRILDKYRDKRGALIAILEDIQSKYRYLPESALRMVAEKTNRSLVDVYGVATFYKLFSLKPRGKHLVSVCLGTACHVRGAPAVADEFERQLGILAGETTQDRQFTLETVNCLGACALGPIVVIDGHYFSHVGPRVVYEIIGKAREGLDRVDIGSDRRIFPIEVRCSRCNHILMDSDNEIDGSPSVRLTVSFGDKHGWVRLSSLYGSYSVDSEYAISTDAVVNFFCPHCHAELAGAANCIKAGTSEHGVCSECGAPMVPMSVAGGGMVQICSRRGCKNRILDVEGDTVE